LKLSGVFTISYGLENFYEKGFHNVAFRKVHLLISSHKTDPESISEADLVTLYDKGAEGADEIDWNWPIQYSMIAEWDRIFYRDIPEQAPDAWLEQAHEDRLEVGE